MAATVEESDVRGFVSGVAQDAKNLLSSYGTLIKLDLRAEIEHAHRLLVGALVTACTASGGVLLLGLSLAHAVRHWFEWSLATSYAAAGAVVVATAGAAALVVRNRIATTPPPTALRKAEKDTQWMLGKT